MGTSERIRSVADILVARKNERQAVVVSAMSKVTDALINVTKKAAAKDPSWMADAQALAEKHRQVARDLLGDKAAPVIAKLDRELHGMTELLSAQAFLGALSDDLLDVVQGLGEVFSSMLLDAHLAARGEKTAWLDAREVLIVDKTPLGAMVDWNLSRQKLDAWKAGAAPNVSNDAEGPRRRRRRRCVLRRGHHRLLRGPHGRPERLVVEFRALRRRPGDRLIARRDGRGRLRCLADRRTDPREGYREHGHREVRQHAEDREAREPHEPREEGIPAADPCHCSRLRRRCAGARRTRRRAPGTCPEPFALGA